MRFTRLAIEGAFLIDIEPHQDERGFFARTFCSAEFEQHGLSGSIAQCSTSYNAKRWTLRGIHYQASPHEETKLVRCTAGAIFDVIVDIRRGSKTYGSWLPTELSAGNRRLLYIPAGVAHGFQTIEDETEVFYQMSVDFHSDASRGIHWDDPTLAISWPERNHRIMSARDEAFPPLARLGQS